MSTLVSLGYNELIVGNGYKAVCPGHCLSRLPLGSLHHLRQVLDADLVSDGLVRVHEVDVVVEGAYRCRDGHTDCPRNCRGRGSLRDRRSCSRICLGLPSHPRRQKISEHRGCLCSPFLLGDHFEDSRDLINFCSIYIQCLDSLIEAIL